MKRLILRASLILLCVCLIASVMIISMTESSEAVVAQSSASKNDSSSVYQANSLADYRRQFPHFPITVNYDEQLGITFTQNFTSLEYNVTAVEQTDPTLATGPAYLLNGLSNKGYWYQVGLSWDWSSGAGFDMNYEVWWNFLGISIDPLLGGGLVSFSGPVNAGDTIALGMNFTTSGEVVMSAQDLNTGASAEFEYSAEGASYFAGLNSDANANGYFTGLMTEWYHGTPYYSDPAETEFSSSLPLSSAWMWMDEFNAADSAPVFANTSSLTTFSTMPTTLQEFSYGNVTEYGSAYEFVTGAVSNSTTSSVLTVTATSATTVTIGIPTVVSVTVTQTETQTQIKELLFPWAYGAMAALLVMGAWIGYTVRRPKSSPG